MRFGTTGFRRADKNLKDLDLQRELLYMGKRRSVIDKIFPLERIAVVYRYVEMEKKTGSVVINSFMMK